MTARGFVVSRDGAFLSIMKRASFVEHCLGDDPASFDIPILAVAAHDFIFRAMRVTPDIAGHSWICVHEG
jgi:hypothetical protein